MDVSPNAPYTRTFKVYGKAKYLYSLNFNVFGPRGGLDMFLKVIYPNGTAGMVKATELQQLLKSGKIIAFLCSEGWIEARRKRKSTYPVERRRNSQQSFYARF